MSAFHYQGIHHNSKCTRPWRLPPAANAATATATATAKASGSGNNVQAQQALSLCFAQYCADPKWQNVATKVSWEERGRRSGMGRVT